jgi:hypothetical protein
MMGSEIEVDDTSSRVSEFCVILNIVRDLHILLYNVFVVQHFCEVDEWI